jgi:quinol monooxygenase YgiN
MVIVTATVEVKPENLEEALSSSLVHVRRSRAEPGCLSHSVNQDAEDPKRLVFLERWADRAALAAHFAVPEARDFSRALGGLTASRPEMTLYEAETFTP